MENVTTVKRQAKALSRKYAEELSDKYVGMYLATHAPEVWYSVPAVGPPEKDSRRALLLRLQAAVEWALDGTP